MEEVLESNQEVPESPLKGLIENYKASIKIRGEKDDRAGHYFTPKVVISKYEKRYPVLDIIECIGDFMIPLMMIGLAIIVINSSFLFTETKEVLKQYTPTLFMNMGYVIIIPGIIGFLYKTLIYNPLAYKMDVYFDVLTEKLDTKYR